MTEEKNGKTGDQERNDARAQKRDTSRIELSDAEADDGGAAESKEPLSVRKLVGESGKSEAAKSSTSRISLDEAEDVSDEERIEMGKDATVRVDLTGAMARLREMSEKGGAGAAAAGDKDESSPESTARISLGAEEQPSTPTTREPDEERPDATARIALEAIESAAPTAEPPRTVRLKRPSSTPRTVVMNRPSSEQPRTVVLKKPGEGEAAASEGATDQPAEKGTTSRIQVPDSEIPAASPSGRKTIRIKRSGGGASSSARTLTIARPGKKAAPVTAPAGSDDEALQDLHGAVADEPGPVFVLLALAAVLVLCALLYLLAAQTIAPGLTLPGGLA